MTLLVKSLVFALASYLAIVAVLAVFQQSLIFPRHMVGAGPALPNTAERLTLATQEGDVLRGVRIPGQDPKCPTLLGFPGNAWNSDSMALFLHHIAPEHDVVVYHYRGYGPSTGTPSARALTADAGAIHDSLDGQVVAIGFSLGSGVAAHLAGTRQLQNVILVTPFDSLKKVAADTLPYLPVRWVFQHEIAAADALSSYDGPMTLLMATKDNVIPAARTRCLARALPDATLVQIASGHNDVYTAPEFVPTLRNALR